MGKDITAYMDFQNVDMTDYKLIYYCPLNDRLVDSNILKTESELTVNAARASKPGSVSTELKLSSEKEKSITCGCFPQNYGPYEVREKTLNFGGMFSLSLMQLV